MEGLWECITALLSFTTFILVTEGTLKNQPPYSSEEPTGCEIETGLADVTWQQNLTGTIVDVIWGYGKTTNCNDQASCFGLNSSVTLPVQLRPMQIQEGVILRFLLADLGVQTSGRIQLYKVSQLGFQSCTTTYGTPVTDSTMDKSLLLNQSQLTQGQNLFIAGSDSPLLQCQFGLRLNVTVKPNKCIPPDKPDASCSNRGLCMSSLTEDSYICRCCQGYSGPFCQEYDGCLQNECDPLSRCVDVIQGKEGTDYQCICPDGKMGLHCDVDVNECNSNPCIHGVCQDENGRFQCYCQPGYTGTMCEMQYNECISDPCLNNGRCEDRLNGYKCRCPGGYFGVHCEMKRNFCGSDPCHNATKCIDQTASYTCVCLEGFAGPDCTHNIDECLSSPCQHGGTCMDLVAGYDCQCSDEYTGKHCEDVKPLTMTAPDRNQYFLAIGLLASALTASFGLIAACGCWVQKARGPRKIEPLGGYFDDDDRFMYDVSSISMPRPSVQAIYEATSAAYNPDPQEPLVHTLTNKKV